MLIKNAKGALQMVSINEAIINDLRKENQTLQEKMKSDITEATKDTVKKYMGKDPSIQNIEALLKRVLIGLEDLQNRSKTRTVTFTNINEENESIWEDYSTAHFPSIFVKRYLVSIFILQVYLTFSLFHSFFQRIAFQRSVLLIGF